MVDVKEVEGKKTCIAGCTSEYILKEVLLGVTIGCAQIPESVAFAFLAHIKPPIALHAAWIVGLFCSLLGGRPGMVNGATGAFAAIIATFLPMPEIDGGNGEGIELLFPSVMLAGFLMLGVSACKLSRFILLLPAPVMVGFCNGLAIVIGMAQLHPFTVSVKTYNTDGTLLSTAHEYKQNAELYWMLAITAASMITMEFLPKVPLKIFKLIPSSLVAIIVACVMEFAIVRTLGSRTDTIGDVSKFDASTRFPQPFFVDWFDATDYDLSKITESWSAIGQIINQGVLLCIVGSIESLMTSEVVESFVKTPSDGERTVAAMGVGNILSGFLGGMGGNAMIGLSTINVLNGGTGRLAPTVTALVVMISIVGAYPILNYIPVAALAGIMLVVVLHTFKWFSLKLLVNCLPRCGRKHLGTQSKIPRIEVFVIVLVTLLSIFSNIAYAVIAGVAVCSMAFSWNAGQILEVKVSKQDGRKVYTVDGPMFFTSANKLKKLLACEDDGFDKVEVWFGYSSLMDYTAIATLHGIAVDYKSAGKTITYNSLNLSSVKIIEKANAMVQAIEFTPTAPMSVQKIPGIADGFAQHPAARLVVDLEAPGSLPVTGEKAAPALAPVAPTTSAAPDQASFAQKDMEEIDI